MCEISTPTYPPYYIQNKYNKRKVVTNNMEFVITNGSQYIKEDFRGLPVHVNDDSLAVVFDCASKANRYLDKHYRAINTKNKMSFCVRSLHDIHNEAKLQEEIGETLDSSLLHDFRELDLMTAFESDFDEDFDFKNTPLEDEDFCFPSFLTNAIKVFSNLKEYTDCMKAKEHEIDDMIADLRHFERDESTNLTGVQMQNLGYYRQELERKRKHYKTNRILGEVFFKDIGRIQNNNYIKVIDRIINSEYKYRRLSEEDIDTIINTDTISERWAVNH